LEPFKLSVPAAKEVLECKHSFAWFRRHLKIINRETSKLVRFKLNRAQLELEDFANKHSFRYILKPRQRGSTTYWIARLFWKALLYKNHRSLIVLHTHDAALKVFQMVERFYDNLPDLLKVPTTKRSNGEVIFAHGGVIRVTSAESASARSSTYNAILMSEFAHYEHATEAIAAILQTLTEDGEVTLETTAAGINHAQRMWLDTASGFAKLFLSWRYDPDCRDKVLAPGVIITSVVMDFAAENNLDEEQTNWMARTLAQKCAGNIRIFCQEYPLTAEMAFVSSGDRVFPHLSYPHGDDKPCGLITLESPSIGRCVVLGVDTANGSQLGDASALVAIDVANRQQPVLLETFQDRLTIPDFAQVAYNMAKKWDALTVVETNGIGQGTLDNMRQMGWGKFYRKVKHDKIEDRWQETIGFNMTEGTKAILVSKLHQYIGQRMLVNVHREYRLQAQIQAWQYDDKGKPTHPPGQHDDLLIACGLALCGMDEIGMSEVEASVYAKRPVGVDQILAWEHATGNIYYGNEDFGDDASSNDHQPLQSLQDVLGARW